VNAERLEWALRWAQKGFRVFPLWPGSKKPAFKDWDWTAGATRDEDQIRAWWAQRDFNIGVLADGLIILDKDVKRGKRGDDSLRALNLDLEDFDTLTVRSPSNGEHLYYSGPVRTNSAGKLGDGLDVRSGHGYVVGPGSYIDERVDPSAGCSGFYTVVYDAPVLPCPQTLLSRLDAPLQRSQTDAVVTLDSEIGVRNAEHFLAFEAPLAVQGAGGDLTTFKTAAWCKDLGLSEEMTYALMLEYYLPRCDADWPLDQQEAWLRDKVHNAYQFTAKAAGSDSPEHLFSGVSIEPPEVQPQAPTVWMRHGDDWEPNQSWLYYQTLPARGVVFLTGPSGSGKTFLLMDLARSLATGRPWLDVAPDDRGGTVVLFAGTEGSGFADRLQALGEDGVLPISATQVGELRKPGALGAIVNMVREEAARMREAFGVPLRMVVLETLSASGLMEDENSSADAAQALSNLAELGRHLGVVIVVSHHPPKSGSGVRGSGAITDNADYHISVSRQGKEAVRKVDLQKARGAQERSLGAYTLLPVKLGKDDRSRDVVSMTVSFGRSGDVPGVEPQFAALMVECIDWACIEDPTTIGGEDVAAFDEVKRIFRERKPGGRNQSTLLRAWNAALEFSTKNGSVEDLVYKGERFLKRRKEIK
jgi:hypothetical protein